MSKRAYFGTDGIRGEANRHPMTAEVALRVGMAAGKMFMSSDERRHLVVIGKDTRLSGYMIGRRWWRGSPAWAWTCACSAPCRPLGWR